MLRPFLNQVFEVVESNALDLYVSDFFEDESITHIYAQVEGVPYSEYKSKVQQEIEKSDPHHWEDEAEKQLENTAILERYQETFPIVERNTIWVSTKDKKRKQPSMPLQAW